MRANLAQLHKLRTPGHSVGSRADELGGEPLDASGCGSHGRTATGGIVRPSG